MDLSELVVSCPIGSAGLAGFHIVTLYFIYTLFQIETKDSGILQAYKMLSMKSDDSLCRESDR